MLIEVLVESINAKKSVFSRLSVWNDLTRQKTIILTR